MTSKAAGSAGHADVTAAGSGSGTEPGGGVGEPAVPGPATVSGNITALNPADGLFLRAEHLKAMQTYARELSQAVGIGSGTGVVYGFEVTLDESKPALNVRPGLAISALGQPLRSMAVAVVSLVTEDLPPVGPDGFWVIEANPAWWNFGNESVYGNLCDEPCSGAGSSLQPWTAEGVTISLRPDDMPGLAGVESVRRRNWLASKYFERERSRSGPWLVPRDATGVVGSIRTRDWTQGIVPPVRSGVPIGVIQLVEGGWMLDVWTARRDIGGPPADNAWRARLAMRPWNVFLAEVLQFQDQLSALVVAEPTVVRENVAEPGESPFEKFFAQVKDTPMANWKAFKELASSYQEAAAPAVSASTGQSLQAHGVDELPPTGFLSGVQPGAVMGPELGTLFGQNVDLRICHVRADYVPGAVEQARDLDRIPLNSEFGKVKVDILVPDVPADLKGLRTDAYGWVAFVRRREATCDVPPPEPEPDPKPEPESDQVNVYQLEGTVEAVLEAVKAGSIPGDATPVARLSYPPDSWEYPGSEAARKVSVPSNRAMAIIVIASAEDRQPLAALRGSLFGASLDGGMAPPPVWSLAPAKVNAEAIIVVLEPAPEPTPDPGPG